MSPSGAIALVTGGANGIGSAVVRRLARDGARVVLADLDEGAGARLAEEVGGHFVRCDVSDPGDSAAAVAAATDRFGGLDLVHLNAGVTSSCGVGDDFDPALYRRAIGVNLDGVVYGIHAALPALAGRPGAQIIVTASLAGLTGLPGEPIYTANKHAVVGLVRSLGPTLLAEHGVRINALCPGFADTALLEEEIRTLLRSMDVPLLTTAEVVEAFVRIVEDGRSGQCWFVQVGRPSEPFRFPNLPGPRTP